ncbi:MAG: Lon protease family protein, partial [Acidobacteriota bacterium]
MTRPEPLPCEALRWCCDPATLPFATTAEIEPESSVVGQPAAVEALRFGLACHAPGQNIFIRGLTGTGRMTLVSRLLDELAPTCSRKWDRAYVHHFAQPDRPRLISLPAGQARAFRRKVDEFAIYIRDGLPSALASDAVKSRRDALEEQASRQIEALSAPFEKELKEAGLSVVSVQLGPITQAALVPVVDGKPVPPEEFNQLHEQGKVTDEVHAAYASARDAFAPRVEEITSRIHHIRQRTIESIRELLAETARAVLTKMARSTLLAEFTGDDVAAFVGEVVEDVIENRLSAGEALPDPRHLYGVNVVSEHAAGDACPIVEETAPTLGNLLGSVDREWTPQGPAPSDYRMIRAGSLLRADGGYLILDVRDVLGEPGAWKVLERTLRTGKLEIVPPELSLPLWQASIKPEPIPIDVKVILLGDSRIYHLLDAADEDFSHLFKVLADFDSIIEREPDGAMQYAGVLARIVREEGLPPLDASAVAALVEHGVRIASHRGKLTARFGRIADLAREAAHITRQASRDCVSAAEVEDAVRRSKSRAELPSRRFRQLLAEGILHVQVTGEVAGQVNGLAVMTAGPLTYGFPARITASIGPGSAGIVDIEEQAALSGSIHTKGFRILGGLLRNLLHADHPLAFSASLAFEQSYGGIDGDSASGAEICCLLSALTALPVRQGIAMTGAIDQHGRIMAIGGVNEKIEGFFDACHDIGLSGRQGVIIPATNVGDLMLRQDVVDACAAGRFSVYPVTTVCEALELLTGMPAGEPDADGVYPEGTVLAAAVTRAREYWTKTLQSPQAPPRAAHAEADGPPDSDPASDEEKPPPM